MKKQLIFCAQRISLKFLFNFFQISPQFLSTMKGMTLIEMLIYIGIVSLVLVVSISYAWTVIRDQHKQQLEAEVNYVGNFVIDKIIYSTTRAQSFGANVYGSNPGKIVLNYASDPAITIDTYSKAITLGDKTINITKLRLAELGIATNDLTSDRVNVTNFLVTNLSTAGTQTVKIDLTVSAVNPENLKQYEATKSWSVTATIRAK